MVLKCFSTEKFQIHHLGVLIKIQKYIEMDEG